METKVPQGKLAEMHWSALSEMAREAKTREADAVVALLNSKLPPGRLATWSMGWRGVQLTIHVPSRG